MRSAFVEDLLDKETYELKGDLLHHLVNVVRIESGEEILLLNGKGLNVRCRVESVTKKSLGLRKLGLEEVRERLPYDLVIGIPKREALELALKEAVELGFQRIFLVRSSYSQTRVPEAERLKALLISALEQSNADFLPEVRESSWEHLPWDDYGTVLILDSKSSGKVRCQAENSRTLLVVGPEGGFSAEETELLSSKPLVERLCLPTPILRTPTAVATGAGILLQRLMS